MIESDYYIVENGTPSGVQAPIGAVWRQRDANSTHGDLLGLAWKKVGLGTTLNTDWLVDYEGRWISYTPSLTNMSGGTVTGTYTRTGRTVHFRARWVAGTMSTDPRIGIPVVSPSSYRIPIDSMLGGPSGYYQSIAELYDTSVGLFYTNTTQGQHASIGATQPFTWATNNWLVVSGTYDI